MKLLIIIVLIFFLHKSTIEKQIPVEEVLFKFEQFLSNKVKEEIKINLETTTILIENITTSAIIKDRECFNSIPKNFSFIDLEIIFFYDMVISFSKGPKWFKKTIYISRKGLSLSFFLNKLTFKEYLDGGYWLYSDIIPEKYYFDFGEFNEFKTLKYVLQNNTVAIIKEIQLKYKNFLDSLLINYPGGKLGNLLINVFAYIRATGTFALENYRNIKKLEIVNLKTIDVRREGENNISVYNTSLTINFYTEYYSTCKVYINKITLTKDERNFKFERIISSYSEEDVRPIVIEIFNKVLQMKIDEAQRNY